MVNVHLDMVLLHEEDERKFNYKGQRALTFLEKAHLTGEFVVVA